MGPPPEVLWILSVDIFVVNTLRILEADIILVYKQFIAYDLLFNFRLNCFFFQFASAPLPDYLYISFLIGFHNILSTSEDCLCLFFIFEFSVVGPQIVFHS